MRNLFDLSGKRALITGSAQGIGHLLAGGLAEYGAEIIINDRTERARTRRRRRWWRRVFMR